MQTVSSIRNNGVIITQEAMSDALEIAGKSNKVMKKYQAERQTYPPRIVRLAGRGKPYTIYCTSTATCQPRGKRLRTVGLTSTQTIGS